MREQHAHLAAIVGRSFRLLEGLDDDGVHAASRDLMLAVASMASTRLARAVAPSPRRCRRERESPRLARDTAVGESTRLARERGSQP